jgi:methionyl-tRNA formyltransferase
MRLIFAGTPAFAAAALDALAEAGHDIALVLTQPDRPAGRGMKLTPSAVKQAAQARGLPVFQPTSLKPAEAQAALRAVAAEVMVVAAYGLILPQAVLDIPRRGCLNIHASLLPRWRGAAPIQRAILAGDEVTGITIMQMDAGLDTGAMLLKATVPIHDEDTAGSLHDTLARVGAASIVEALARLDELTPQAQDDALATYAAKLTKEEARLDWSRACRGVGARRACLQPGSRGAYPAGWPDGENLAGHVASAEPRRVAVRAKCWRPDERGIVVACGEGDLEHRRTAAGRRQAHGRRRRWSAGHAPAAGQDISAERGNRQACPGHAQNRRLACRNSRWPGAQEGTP